MNNKVINFEIIFNRIIEHRSLYIKVLIATFIVSCIIIFPIPRTYSASVSLAPEADNSGIGGSLSSMASSLGLDLGGGLSSDAINVDLYPDLINSTGFLVGLFDVPVNSIDGTIETNYYNYIDKMQKKSIWEVIGNWFKAMTAYIMPKDNTPLGNNTGTGVDPFRLNRRQTSIINKMRKTISCSIDNKTSMITITYEDQDPQICACMTDSIREHLQNAIISYRTSKARHDLEYYTKLEKQAKQNYEEAIEKYSTFTDAHVNLNSQRYKSELDRLQLDVEFRQQAYSTLSAQIQAAEARVLASTPVFTTVQNATIPIKPSGPKRMIFVAGMMFLAFIITTAIKMRDLYL